MLRIVQEMKAEYSGKISILENKIADLKKLILSYEETIASKNEIISMLKRRLGEEK